MYNNKNLRHLLRGDQICIAPGASDALTARLIQQAGFPAVYMTGFGATASRLGAPDIGLLTQTEMTTLARDMVRAIDIPVIADADTGYGGLANIARTVAEYKQAGVAAIHLEDQTMPKRCGQMAGVKVIEVKEAVKRLKCALEVRGNDDLLIIGRTDALPSVGLEAALYRAKAFQEAGVDLVFIDGVKRIAEAEAIAKEINGPKIISIVEANETANLTSKDLESMGFTIALYALSALSSAIRAIADTLNELRDTGTTKGRVSQMASYEEITRIVDHDYYQRLDDRFGST